MSIIQADILKWAATYDGPKYHAMLSDPPYHLTSITDRFGKPGAAPAQGGVYARSGAGFMGKDWDGGDIAFRSDTWAAIAAHLYPGAWGMAFAGSRGWHRMACAIEDAGLIMQPTIFGWSYGSGFPKATNIAAQIDDQAFREWLALHPAETERLTQARLEARALKALAKTNVHYKAEAQQAHKHATQLRRAIKAAAGFAPIVGTKKHQPKFAAAELGYREKDNGYNNRDRDTFDLIGCATEAARDWIGHRYGGQAIKPAIEPIIVFQKPYDGSPLANITSTGAGALWIDGGRIASGEDCSRVPSPNNGIVGSDFGIRAAMGGTGHEGGRWPANFILSHSPACNGHCAPGCPVAQLGAQSGERAAGGSKSGLEPSDRTKNVWGHFEREPWESIGDTGTAARFFFQADYMHERLELADAIAYIAKSSRAEREAGLDPRYTAIMRLLDDSDDDDDMFAETTIDDGRAVPIDNPYQRGETARRNTHPTIKPISLTRYLATLLLPPAQYGPRRLLVPFSGAGSEMIGADLAGWEDVTGVELEADHVAIANARRAYWQQRRWELGDSARKLTIKVAPKVPAGQVDMFESEAA